VPEAVAKLTEGKSAASFCCQVAAWSPDMFGNFYFVKNKKKIAKNSTNPKAREKKEHSFGILTILEIFYCMVRLN